MKKSHMTCAIVIYNISIIFGAVSLPFLSGSLLKVIALLIILFWFEQKFRVRPTKFDVLFLLYLGVMVFSLLYTIDITATKQRVISNIQFCLLLFATNSVSFDKEERRAIKNSLTWCSRITAIVLLAIGGTGADRLLLNGSLLTEDPNYLNGYFIFGVVAAIQALIYSDSTFRRRIAAVMELLLYIYCCLATGSRGGMFCLFAAAGLYFLISKEESGFKPIIKKMLILASLGIAFAAVLSVIPESVSSRFTVEAIAESNGTHRYEYWGQLLTIFKNSNLFRMLFGYGAGTVRSVFSIHGYMSHVAHNIYVEQLLEGGIILDLVYVIMLVHLIVKSLKKKDFYSISVIAGFMVLAMSTSLYAFKPYWAIMMFVNLRDCEESNFEICSNNLKRK